MLERLARLLDEEGGLIATLVRPAGQSQGPKLRDAIKSLKLVHAAAGGAVAGVTVTATGLVEKVNKPRAPFFTAIDHYRAQVGQARLGCSGTFPIKGKD